MRSIVQKVQKFLLFDACELDYGPMDLVLKLDIDIVVTYFDTENEVNRPNSSNAMT